MNRNENTRRVFLKNAVAGGAALALSAYGIGAATAQPTAGVDESLFKTINRAKNPAKLEGLERGHVPIVTAPESVTAGQSFEVKVQVGEKMHEMIPSHYIDWVDLYADDIFLTRVTLTAMFTEARFKVMVMLKTSATLRAIEHCNLHGLWEGATRVEVKA